MAAMTVMESMVTKSFYDKSHDRRYTTVGDSHAQVVQKTKLVRQNNKYKTKQIMVPFAALNKIKDFIRQFWWHNYCALQ